MTYDRDAEIDSVLIRNAAYAHGATMPRTPLEELLAGEDDPDEDEEAREDRMAVRVQNFRRLVDFFLEDGADPMRVLRRFFAVAKAVRPEAIGDMSLEDISIICCDGGKATVSARIERVVNRTIEKAGMKATVLPFQKRSAKYAQAQMGNGNRTKSIRKKKRRSAE